MSCPNKFFRKRLNSQITPSCEWRWEEKYVNLGSSGQWSLKVLLWLISHAMKAGRREAKRGKKINAREREWTIACQFSSSSSSFSWTNKFENKFGRYFWIISENLRWNHYQIRSTLRELTLLKIDVHNVMYLFYSIFCRLASELKLQHPTSRSKKIVEKGKNENILTIEWVCVAHVYLFIYSFFSSLIHSLSRIYI